MRKFFLTGLFAGCAFFLSAQVGTQIIGDSVFIHGNTGKAEMILRNSTDTVKGFLFNKGDGRTEFRRGLVKISDSVYLIGADTLHYNNTDGILSTDNVYYVSRKFSGNGRTVVSGYTLSAISSSNQSYNAQLLRAAAGSMIFSYPDPFSARNAAMESIAAGKIDNAVIIVMDYSSYTIGSPDSTKNGSIDGMHANNGTVADIQFSGAALDADSSLSSIMKDKIKMFFGTGSSLTYINSAYPIYCYYFRDITNSNFRSGVYGSGSFYQVYGQAHGFYARFL